MRKSFNKDNDVAASTPGRRSLRHSKPPEEEAKSIVKVRKYVGKKKEDSAENKNEEGKNETDNTNCSKSNQSSNETDGETATAKPTTSRRSGRKRQLSEEADNEADDDKLNGKKEHKKDDKEDEKSDDKKDDKSDDQKEESEQSEKNSSELKNGRSEDAVKVKTRKKRKPPTKKRKEEQDESELWTPLESLDDDDKKDTQRKPQSKTESKRKQALVERHAPADPMLQKQPPRHRRNSGGSECEVLVSVPRTHRRSKTIVTVDIDDEASETGSIQIVAEPDVDSVFDFKRLLIQYRNVNLPSSLWGVHKDPRKSFVSFTRFNPDFPDTNGVFVDRAVVFKGSLHPEAFVNGENLDLPEMFNVVETIYEASQVIEFVNNLVVSVTHPPVEPSDEAC